MRSAAYAVPKAPHEELFHTLLVDHINEEYVAVGQGDTSNHHGPQGANVCLVLHGVPRRLYVVFWPHSCMQPQAEKCYLYACVRASMRAARCLQCDQSTSRSAIYFHPIHTSGLLSCLMRLVSAIFFKYFCLFVIERVRSHAHVLPLVVCVCSSNTSLMLHTGMHHHMEEDPEMWEHIGEKHEPPHALADPVESDGEHEMASSTAVVRTTHNVEAPVTIAPPMPLTSTTQGGRRVFGRSCGVQALASGSATRDDPVGYEPAGDDSNSGDELGGDDESGHAADMRRDATPEPLSRSAPPTRKSLPKLGTVSSAMSMFRQVRRLLIACCLQDADHAFGRLVQ